MLGIDMTPIPLPHLDPEIREFLAQQFAEDSDVELSKPLQDLRGITRQAANALLTRLIKAGVLKAGANQKPKSYELADIFAFMKTYSLKGLEEHLVWSKDISPYLTPLCSPESLSIWEYGFTEMINNAIDHSEGTEVKVFIAGNVLSAVCSINDNGEGIFARITRLCKLSDERQALLELAKGKLTTDRANHSGEGVFFTSRAFDWFSIRSGVLNFSHLPGNKDYLFDNHKAQTVGTAVSMEQTYDTHGRTLKAVFDEFSAPDEYSFSKTVVPVRLARLPSENLVSRSQAQRLLARVDRFKTVLFDFEEVDSVGQAFSDEIFRVFARAHPDVEIHPINANEQILRMIKRAQSHES